MKYRQQRPVENDWYGEFRTYEGRDLDRNPRTEVLLSWMVKAELALLSKISLGHETMVHSR